MQISGQRRFIGTIRDISERKYAERAFRENAEELDAIYQTAGVGIGIADCNGRFLRCNKRLEEMLGYSEAEFVSTDITNLSHPDDIDQGERLRREIFEGKRKDFQLDCRLIRKDGTVIWVMATVAALKNADGEVTATVGIAEDISERKRVETALETSERRYRSLFETSQDGILISDMDGNLQDANPAILALLGYELD